MKFINKDGPDLSDRYAGWLDGLWNNFLAWLFFGKVIILLLGVWKLIELIVRLIRLF